jgi:small subunit ribosomal protein S19e
VVLLTTPFDVNPNDLIGLVALKLKDYREVSPPQWATFAKTGVHKERIPDDPDWWYIRSAAVLRTIHNDGPVGIERLRTKYGGKKSQGNRPPSFAKGSGSIQRKICQQLEAAGLIAKTDKDGRGLSPKGRSILDKCAQEIATR